MKTINQGSQNIFYTYFTNRFRACGLKDNIDIIFNIKILPTLKENKPFKVGNLYDLA